MAFVTFKGENQCQNNRLLGLLTETLRIYEKRLLLSLDIFCIFDQQYARPLGTIDDATTTVIIAFGAF